jgi:hypothetical protein
MTIWLGLPIFAPAQSSGVDTALFWQIISGMGVVIGTLAGMLYKGERDRRIEAERKLEKFTDLAPDLSESVRRLIELERERPELPWPYAQRPSSPRPRSRRRQR